jgi:hypothetical protein
LRPLADIEEVTRDWLKTFDGGKYERYSVCEVILTAPEFSHMKHCVGPADWFCSHADSEALMGASNIYPNGTGRDGTLNMLGVCAYDHKNLRLDSVKTKDGKGFSFFWVDYTR